MGNNQSVPSTEPGQNTDQELNQAAKQLLADSGSSFQTVFSEICTDGQAIQSDWKKFQEDQNIATFFESATDSLVRILVVFLRLMVAPLKFFLKALLVKYFGMDPNSPTTEFLASLTGGLVVDILKNTIFFIFKVLFNFGFWQKVSTKFNEHKMETNTAWENIKLYWQSWQTVFSGYMEQFFKRQQTLTLSNNDKEEIANEVAKLLGDEELYKEIQPDTLDPLIN